MRTIFYGTPALAAPFLELLARKSEVVCVITGPDQPAGRDLRVRPTPVKTKSLELGLKVLQPDKPAAVAAELKALKPDLAVAVAYGKILPPAVLSAPALGSLNVHFSLLPKYRGAAPVQWSLWRGESRTGVTVFWLDEKMDAGPVFIKRELDIGPDEAADGLFARLTTLGLQALGEALDEVGAGRILREPQAGEPSFAPRLNKEDGRMSLDRDARDLHNQARGLRLWPTAYLELKPPAPRHVRVLKTALAGIPAAGAIHESIGRIVRVEQGGGILIQCQGSSSLWLVTVQPEGKKPVAAADFLNGLRIGVGDFLPLA